MWNKIKQKWLLADRLLELSIGLATCISAIYHKKKTDYSFVLVTNLEIQEWKNRNPGFTEKQYNYAFNEAFNKLNNKILGFDFKKVNEGLLIIKGNR